jgi:hypothetical protein
VLSAEPSRFVCACALCAGMADAPVRRVTRSVSRASSASSDGVAGAAAGDATATSGAPTFANRRARTPNGSRRARAALPRRDSRGRQVCSRHKGTRFAGARPVRNPYVPLSTSQHGRQTHKLGLFDTAEDAARAFDRAAFRSAKLCASADSRLTLTRIQ